nr:MAG TPA: hypothetical protein [Caudoviricetes sp.]
MFISLCIYIATLFFVLLLTIKNNVFIIQISYM